MDILIVDESEAVRSSLSRLLERYEGVSACVSADPVFALNEAREHAFDLVLVDQHVSGMDGVDFIRALRAIPHYEHVPIAMGTADACEASWARAVESGATDIFDKRAEGVDLDGPLRNLVLLARTVRRLNDKASALALEVEQTTRRLQEREAEVIFRLALAVEFRDSDTGDHTWRVARYSQFIAEALGLEPEICRRLYVAAPLRDVGKVAIPDGILLKKGRLDEAEHALIRTYTVVGRRILDGNASDLIRMAAEIAESHHERWDGNGYPCGLAGRNIPLCARIVAVADVFDALTTERPYKAAMGFEEALAYVEAERGGHFDPDCVDAFVAAWDVVRTVRCVSSDTRSVVMPRVAEPWVQIVNP